MRLLTCLAAMVLPSGAAAAVHPPEIEARLAAVVGDWTVEGQEGSFRERCEWYGDRAFVVCTSEDSNDGSASQSIIGYSAADGHFTYHHYASTGSSNSRIGFPYGERGMVYTAERRTPAGIVRMTTTVNPQPDGRIHFREERSLDGGPWTEAVQFFYVARTES